MKNLQQHENTLLDPDIESQLDLYHFSEWLARGLPSRRGNSLLLLKIGVPLPSAGLVLSQTLQDRMNIQLYLDVGPGKDFVRHERPCGDTSQAVTDSRTDEGGPVYRLQISQLPIPQKHQVLDRIEL